MLHKPDNFRSLLQDHACYLAAEKGDLGVSALQAMIRTFDPAGALDSGNLLPKDSRR